MKPTKEQYEATAKHHEKVAKAYAAVGDKRNEQAALKAAELCRKSAKEIA
jgi:hypothetical protein